MVISMHPHTYDESNVCISEVLLAEANNIIQCEI
jgi:hypothetical protein